MQTLKRLTAIVILLFFTISLATTVSIGLSYSPAIAQTSPIETPVITSTVVPEPQPGETVPVPDNLPMAWALFVLGVFGAAVSFVQEKTFGWDDLKPNTKMVITALTTAVLPAVVNFLTPIWQPEFGDISQFVYAVAWLVGPVVAFLAGQVWHRTVNR